MPAQIRPTQLRHSLSLSLSICLSGSVFKVVAVCPSMDQKLDTRAQDTEDPHVHPLPHRANMNYKHRAQGAVVAPPPADLQ